MARHTSNPPEKPNEKDEARRAKELADQAAEE
jgi:hypothetical protein